MTGGLGLVAALVVTLGVLAIVLGLLRRSPWALAARGGGVPLEVLKRVSLGPKHGVALLRVADRVLVVSIADGGAHLLTELDEAARAEALRGSGPKPDRGHAPSRLPFAGFFALGLAFALSLAPSSSRAQGGAASPPAVVKAPSVSASGAAAPGGAVPAQPLPALAAVGPLSPQVDIKVGEGKNALHLSGAVGLVVFMGLLTLLPAMFLLMTSFTRILIVLHFLRSALGTQTTPPSQLLVAIAVLLTGVVMNPVLQEAQKVAIQPYLDGKITQVQAYQRAVLPFRGFMLANTRDKDLDLFAEMSRLPEVQSVEELPTVTVISAFITSELRTSFQMGFVIFLPFVVLDVIIASVLMSLGMFMLPPMMISLPFKLLLFVLADGWTLVVQNLVASFH